MRFLRYTLLLTCLLSTSFLYAQKEDWLPITQEDLQLKEVPGHPGEPAVRLYYANYIDDNAGTEFVYERIKILNDKGMEPVTGYADARIYVQNDPDVYVFMTDLKARTIHPDGSIADFTGQPFEKVIAKGRGEKQAFKTFSFPNVTVGSIVECKYKLHYQVKIMTTVFFPASTDRWVMQSRLFTMKEHLYFRPFGGGVAVGQSTARPMFYFDGAITSWVSSNLKEKPKNKGNEVELELQNVPAFESEDYMPPEDNYKPTVIFFYMRRGTPTATEKAWQEVGKSEYQKADDFLSKDHGVKEAALQAIKDETESGMKLRRLYERAQQIRNLTYEHERTSEERKKENIQKNESVSDVLLHNYGTSREITLLFIAMARSAGFDASAVEVADRKKNFFNKEYISPQQIDGVMAAVNLNGKDLYLEPGTKFCPYGMVPWSHTAIEGLKLDHKGGTFVKAEPASYDKSITQRSADVSISEDGTLKGNLAVQFKGYDALERRLDEVESDDAGKKKDLEDEVKAWLPVGALVKLLSVEGWDGTDDPLIAHFNIEVPGYATVAGKRFLAQAYLFQTTLAASSGENRNLRQIDKQTQTEMHKGAFKHAERKYPVYFPYPFGELDMINTKIPAGFSVESVPQQQDAGLGYAKYTIVSQFDGLQVVTQRKLLFNGIYVPTEKYSELKGFFDKVQTGDEQQAILRGGSVSAQKGN